MLVLAMTNLTNLNHGRLRTLRHERGLSQEALAELAGVHRNSIANLESGKFGPRMETMARVADALEVPLATLFDPRLPAQSQGGLDASRV